MNALHSMMDQGPRPRGTRRQPQWYCLQIAMFKGLAQLPPSYFTSNSVLETHRPLAAEQGARTLPEAGVMTGKGGVCCSHSGFPLPARHLRIQQPLDENEDHIHLSPANLEVRLNPKPETKGTELHGN